MKSQFCKHCGSRFLATRRSQKYCTEESCRRSRKRQWQRNKLASDPDYRAAQREAHVCWLAKNPDYYRTYRRNNPSYTLENRLKQRIRNRRSREKIAKMDAKMPVITGLYQLLAINSNGDLIAKMETKYVQLTEIKQDAILST